MTVARSVLLSAVAALLETGGAGMVGQGLRDARFGRILAAYGGVFVAGSLLWGCWSAASDRTGTTSRAPRCAGAAWR